VLWVPIFWLLNDALTSLVFTVPPPNTPGCFLIAQKDVLFVVFVLIMSFETVILTLTLVKGLEHFRRASSPLVAVLYRDGMLNYVYLFILSAINLAVITSAPGGYTTTLTAMQRVAHAILSGRILLHLRQAATARVITSRLDPSTGVSAVSATWQFRKNPPADREPRSFIETVRDDFRNDTETWFGTEAVPTESNTSHEMSISTTELEEIGTGNGNGISERRSRTRDEMEHSVRIISGQAVDFSGTEESHLDMDP